MREPIRLRYAATPDEMLHMYRVYDSRHSLSLRAYLKTALIYVFVGALLWHLTQRWFWVLWMPVFGVVTNPIYVRNRRRQQVRQGFARPGAADPIDLTVDHEGLRTISANTDVQCKWSVFEDHTETERAFILYTSPGDCMIIIPKRAFEDDGQADAFRVMVNEKVGGAS